MYTGGFTANVICSRTVKVLYHDGQHVPIIAQTGERVLSRKDSQLPKVNLGLEADNTHRVVCQRLNSCTRQVVLV